MYRGFVILACAVLSGKIGYFLKLGSRKLSALVAVGEWGKDDGGLVLVCL